MVVFHCPIRSMRFILELRGNRILFSLLIAPVVLIRYYSPFRTADTSLRRDPRHGKSR